MRQYIRWGRPLPAGPCNRPNTNSRGTRGQRTSAEKPHHNQTTRNRVEAMTEEPSQPGNEPNNRPTSYKGVPAIPIGGDGRRSGRYAPRLGMARRSMRDRMPLTRPACRGGFVVANLGPVRCQHGALRVLYDVVPMQLARVSFSRRFR